MLLIHFVLCGFMAVPGASQGWGVVTLQEPSAPSTVAEAVPRSNERWICPAVALACSALVLRFTLFCHGEAGQSSPASSDNALC